MGFQVGQRVVCVDADPRGFSEQSLDGLRERGIYLSSRFRPLTERKTDISVFRRLLKPQREDA